MKNIGKRDETDAAPRTSRIARKKRRGGGSRRDTAPARYGRGGAKAWRGTATWAGQAPRKRVRSGSGDSRRDDLVASAAPQVKVARVRAKGGRGRRIATSNNFESKSNGGAETRRRRSQKGGDVPARRAVMSVKLAELIGLPAADEKETPNIEERAPPAVPSSDQASEEDAWILVDNDTRVSSIARVDASWSGVDRSLQYRRGVNNLDTGESKRDSPEEETRSGFLSYFFS